MKRSTSLVTLGSAIALLSFVAGAQQVIVNETFDYADTAAMQLKWTTNAALTLDGSKGNSAPSAAHSGAAVVSKWIGSSFSITPTDVNPLRLTADIWSSGNMDQANTVGLRNGADPLFEMGMYRFFDNSFDATNTSALSLGSGYGVRTISLGKDLPGQDWSMFGTNYTGWARWQATFGTYGVSVLVDLGVDGSWDLSWSETGTTATKAFAELRIHSPVAGTGGGFNVDNIRLEVVPEPSSFALLGAGVAALAIFRRRT